MAITVLEFDPLIHQKVRYRDQLYAVLLQDFDLLTLPPHADVVIHFVTHEKIILATQGFGHYKVKKTQLTLVEPHIIE